MFPRTLFYRIVAQSPPVMHLIASKVFLPNRIMQNPNGIWWIPRSERNLEWSFGVLLGTLTTYLNILHWFLLAKPVKAHQRWSVSNIEETCSNFIHENDCVLKNFSFIIYRFPTTLLCHKREYSVLRVIVTDSIAHLHPLILMGEVRIGCCLVLIHNDFDEEPLNSSEGRPHWGKRVFFFQLFLFILVSVPKLKLKFWELDLGMFKIFNPSCIPSSWKSNMYRKELAIFTMVTNSIQLMCHKTLISLTFMEKIITAGGRKEEPHMYG